MTTAAPFPTPLPSATGWRRLWWVRHGESVGNAGERTRDSASYSLTPRGFAQADRLTAWMVEAPALFVVSPYIRAQQTAAPARRKFPRVPVEEWPIHEISYLAPARTRDTTQIERRALARGFWELLDPHFVDGEGAESFAQFIGRAQAALDRLQTRPEPFIVLFSHAIFMRGLLWLAWSRPARIDREAMLLFHHFSLSLDVPNCGVLPLLCGEKGALYSGPIADPIGAALAPASAESIRLSGL